ncbi:anti-sigma factor family protein [Streptomyces sp. MMG1533]|uniref:anti-sigma factor family protein n=1 Tax=Streptomyces sp. MMG1533 TaxID=1415546 RepID=UPI0006ADA9E9|nr:zf-HC2 domain-containing protein [Streptomyces sp. MMG1533]
MTSTTDTAGHPDVAEISDLAEGLLPPSRTADVRRHLDECEICADVHASLEEIRGLLGTLPGPSRMPDDVAGRIDAALAAEALLQATAPDAVDAPAPVSARSLSDASPASVSGSDDSTHVSRETSATADRPAGHARASTTGPGRKGPSRGGRRRAVVLGAVFTAAALGFGSVLLSSLNDGKPSAPEAQSTSRDTFSEDKLEKQVSDLLAQSQNDGNGSRAPHSFGAETLSGNSPRVFKDPVVPDCIQKGIGRSDAALATDKGIYKGTEALLVVLPDTPDGTRVTAYLMDATCVGQPSPAKAKVLLKQSYTDS